MVRGFEPRSLGSEPSELTIVRYHLSVKSTRDTDAILGRHNKPNVKTRTPRQGKETRQLMYRHNMIFLMINIQYPKDLPPAYRMNTDLIFALGEENPKQRQVLWEMMGGFQTFAEFNEVFDYYTDNYGCLVANRLKQTRDVTRKIFWYKAEINRPPWKMGIKSMWRMHEQHFIGTGTKSHDWSSNSNPSFMTQGGASATSSGAAAGKIKGRARPSLFILHKDDEDGNKIDEEGEGGERDAKAPTSLAAQFKQGDGSIRSSQIDDPQLNLWLQRAPSRSQLESDIDKNNREMVIGQNRNGEYYE